MPTNLALPSDSMQKRHKMQRWQLAGELMQATVNLGWPLATELLQMEQMHLLLAAMPITLRLSPLAKVQWLLVLAQIHKVQVLSQLGA